MRENIDFLGSLVGKKGLRVNPEKVEVLKTCPRPETLTDVVRFVGLFQYFRGFIPKFPEIAASLKNLKRKASA